MNNLSDKEIIFNLERHISILSAPNYNLNIVLNDILKNKIIKHNNTNSKLEKRQNIYNKIHFKKLNNISNILEKEMINLDSNIDIKICSSNEIISKITFLDQEKKELYEDINQIETDMNKSDNTEINITSSSYNDSQLIEDDLLTGDDFNMKNLSYNNASKVKEKKIEDLKCQLSNLENTIKIAKEKIEDKKKKNNLTILENDELTARIKQKNMIIEQTTNEISSMKSKLEDVKHSKVSTPGKVVGFFRNIFKKDENKDKNKGNNSILNTNFFNKKK